MFTILRMQTFDSWDQILYLSMYGCEGYPSYDMLRNNPQATCSNSTAFGWIGPMILLPLAIVGSYILPPVLIGIVTMKFGDASKYFEELAMSKADEKKVLEIDDSALKDFFVDPDRVEKCRKVPRHAFC